MKIVPLSLIHEGQLWYSREGDGVPHHIIGFQKIGHGGWDVDVWYEWHDSNGQRHEHSKNAYVFQIRFFCPDFEQPTGD